jgi:hypothetical protein
VHPHAVYLRALLRAIACARAACSRADKFPPVIRRVRRMLNIPRIRAMILSASCKIASVHSAARLPVTIICAATFARPEQTYDFARDIGADAGPGPAVTGPGLKVTDPELSSAPLTVAPETLAAALTAVRCWRRRPGFGLPARIFSMRNGLPVTVESASAVPRIWPPPSPDEPSIVNIASSLHANDLVQSVHDLDEILLRRHYRVDWLVGCRSLVNHVGVLAAFDARGRCLMVG